VKSAGLDALIEDLIAKRHFQERQSSWISHADKYFLKIPRATVTAPISHAAATGSLDLAYKEMRELQFLARLSTKIVLPLDVSAKFACIIFPRIEGRNVRDVLVQNDIRTKNTLLSDCITLLGELHRSRITENQDHLPRHDYANDVYFPLNKAAQYDARRTSLVIDGFEIRNLLVDPSGKVWFFDPHRLSIGFPEDDLSRFMLSLLMATWGLIRPIPWTSFSLGSLIQRYEEASGQTVDYDVFTYCMHKNIAMRERFASQAVASMPMLRAVGATLYKSIFFSQVKSWSSRV
jgi:hypothetical protein